MTTPTGREVTVAQATQHISKNPSDVLVAPRVAASIVVIIYDHSLKMGGMVHIPLPESKMATPTDPPAKFVDKALPQFLEELTEKGLNKSMLSAYIVGGSQLFNFGGGGGNVLNIGTRNAVTARTLLSRNGIHVEKTETGGNKPRTVKLEIETGFVQVNHPGQEPRYL